MYKYIEWKTRKYVKEVKKRSQTKADMVVFVLIIVPKLCTIYTVAGAELNIFFLKVTVAFEFLIDNLLLWIGKR